MIGVIVPAFITGTFPSSAVIPVVIFMSYILGDLVAIPFSYVFRKQASE
jgi:Fe2+ transport system protein B